MSKVEFEVCLVKISCTEIFLKRFN